MALASADDRVERPSLDSDLEGPLVRSTFRDGGGSEEKHTTIAVTLSVACFSRQVFTCSKGSIHSCKDGLAFNDNDRKRNCHDTNAAQITS